MNDLLRAKLVDILAYPFGLKGDEEALTDEQLIDRVCSEYKDNIKQLGFTAVHKHRTEVELYELRKEVRLGGNYNRGML